MLASQITPQCAPPSPRPSALVGCRIISRIGSCVEVRVAEQRPQQQLAPVVLEQQVVEVRPTGRRRPARPARRCSGPGRARSRAARPSGTMRSRPMPMNAMRGSSLGGASARIAARTSGSRMPRDPLVERQAPRAPGSVGRSAKRVERLQPEQQPERPPRDLGPRSAPPRSCASSARSSMRRHWSGSRSCCEQRERDRPADLARRAGASSPPRGRRRRGPRPSRPRARARTRRCRARRAPGRCANSSSSAAYVPGTGSPSIGPVRDRARRREAERAGLDALAHDARHRRDVLGRGRLVLRARARP